MAAITFDVNAFYAAFPAFQGKVTEDGLRIYFETASIYVTPFASPCNLVLQTKYLNLMTAHIVALNLIIMTGSAPGILVGATIDKVTVQLQPPPEKNQFQWWMNQTPYGQQLLALLQVQSVGGFYVGGLPETSAFRKVGGIF